MQTSIVEEGHFVKIAIGLLLLAMAAAYFAIGRMIPTIIITGFLRVTQYAGAEEFVTWQQRLARALRLDLSRT